MTWVRITPRHEDGRKILAAPFVAWKEESCLEISNKKVVLTWVRAEHSTYLTALSSLASFSPISRESGFCLFLANFSIVAASSRKSIWNVKKCVKLVVYGS